MGLGSVECHRLECSNRQAQDTFESTMSMSWVTSVSLISSNFLLTIKFPTWFQPRTLSDFFACSLGLLLYYYWDTKPCTVHDHLWYVPFISKAFANPTYRRSLPQASIQSMPSSSSDYSNNVELFLSHRVGTSSPLLSTLPFTRKSPWLIPFSSPLAFTTQLTVFLTGDHGFLSLDFMCVCWGL